MKKLAYLFFATFLLFACEETTVNNNSTTNGNEIESNSTPGEKPNDVANSNPSQKEDKADDNKVELLGSELDFSEFNLSIQKANKAGAEWTSSPLSIMLKFTGADVDSNVKSIRSKKLGPGENIENVMVTVEEDGLMDDSVSGTMSILRMKKVEGVWQVYKATRAWKCWKGRGHQTYSGEPCH